MRRLPAIAIAGVLGASALVGPAQIIATLPGTAMATAVNWRRARRPPRPLRRGRTFSWPALTMPSGRQR